MVSLYGQVYVVIAFIHVRKNTKSSMSSDKMEKSLRGSVLPSYTDEDTLLPVILVWFTFVCHLVTVVKISNSVFGIIFF